MENNPYIGILKLLKQNGSNVNIRLGVVNGNNIDVGELQLNPEDCLINNYYKEKPLTTGDIVALYPINNNQKFIILCKVVEL